MTEQAQLDGTVFQAPTVVYCMCYNVNHTYIVIIQLLLTLLQYNLYLYDENATHIYVVIIQIIRLPVNLYLHRYSTYNSFSGQCSSTNSRCSSTTLEVLYFYPAGAAGAAKVAIAAEAAGNRSTADFAAKAADFAASLHILNV